jgi:hypothetical protein
MNHVDRPHIPLYHLLYIYIARTTTTTTTTTKKKKGEERKKKEEAWCVCVYERWHAGSIIKHDKSLAFLISSGLQVH